MVNPSNCCCFSWFSAYVQWYYSLTYFILYFGRHLATVKNFGGFDRKQPENAGFGGFLWKMFNCNIFNFFFGLTLLFKFKASFSPNWNFTWLFLTCKWIILLKSNQNLKVLSLRNFNYMWKYVIKLVAWKSFENISNRILIWG